MVVLMIDVPRSSFLKSLFYIMRDDEKVCHAQSKWKKAMAKVNRL